MLNFDSTSFFSAFLSNMIDNQDPILGNLPDVVPHMRYGGRPADPSWSAAFIQVLYVKYKNDGHLEQAHEVWEEIMLYLKFMEKVIENAGGLDKIAAPYG